MNTGEKIKYFRLAHGITQEQLAQNAEISHVHRSTAFDSIRFISFYFTISLIKIITLPVIPGLIASLAR